MKKKANRPGETGDPRAKAPRTRAAGATPSPAQPVAASKGSSGAPADCSGPKKEKGKSKGKAKERDRDRDKVKEKDKSKEKARGKGKAKGERAGPGAGTPGGSREAGPAGSGKRETPLGLSDDAIRIEAFYVYEERSVRGLPGDPHGDWAEATRRLTLGLRRS